MFRPVDVIQAWQEESKPGTTDMFCRVFRAKIPGNYGENEIKILEEQYGRRLFDLNRNCTQVSVVVMPIEEFEK